MLPDDTIIEVIATKKGVFNKKTMSVAEWKSLKKTPGYTYTAYQLGFSQYQL